MQLRNFKNQFDKAMESMSTFFKEENDILYCRGYRKGFEEGYRQGLEEARNELFKEWLEEVIGNLLEKFGFSDEQIASAANVPVERVQKIPKRLGKK